MKCLYGEKCNSSYLYIDHWLKHVICDISQIKKAPPLFQVIISAKNRMLHARRISYSRRICVGRWKTTSFCFNSQFLKLGPYMIEMESIKNDVVLCIFLNCALAECSLGTSAISTPNTAEYHSSADMVTFFICHHTIIQIQIECFGCPCTVGL